MPRNYRPENPFAPKGGGTPASSTVSGPPAPDDGADDPGFLERLGLASKAAMHGVTLGASTKIIAAGRAATGQGSFHDMLAEENADRERVRSAHPVLEPALEMAAGAAIPIGNVGTEATFARRALQAAKAGAVQGGVAGAIASPSLNPLQILERAFGGAAEGAVAGGVAGAAGDVAIRGAGAVGSKIGSSAAALTRRAAGAVGRTNLPAGIPAAAREIEDAIVRTETGNRLDRARRIIGSRIEAEPEGFAGAHRTVDELEAANRGDDAMLLNAGGGQVTRLARGARSMPVSNASGTLNTALADQGSRVAPRVQNDLTEVTGLPREEGPVALQRMQQDLQAKTGPVFERFRALGDLATQTNPRPTRIGKQDPLAAFFGHERAAADLFRPYVDAVRRLSPTLSKLKPTDAAVLDDAFKLLQQDIRKADQSTDRATQAHLLKDLREKVLGRFDSVMPEYRQVVSSYRLDPDAGKAVQSAYDIGRGLPNRPASEATQALLDIEPTMVSRTPGPGGPAAAKQQARSAPEREALRRGAVTGYQDRVAAKAANPDLGELAAFRDVWRGLAGSADDKAKLRTLLGEDEYGQLMNRAKAEMRLAAQNAGVRGNSTTADKLGDLHALSLDSMDEFFEDVLKSGGPRAALWRRAMQTVSDRLERRRLQLTGETAGDVASELTTRGAPKIRLSLKAIETLMQQDRARQIPKLKITAGMGAAGGRTAVNR